MRIAELPARRIYRLDASECGRLPMLAATAMLSAAREPAR
jgi:hypothetical protein